MVNLDLKLSTLIISTNNKHKQIELIDLLSPFIKNIVPFSKYSNVEIPETGKTFEENAYIKASFASKETKLWALADDSGLVVPALNGAPGIYSARYSARFEGDKPTDEENRSKLLNEMSNLSQKDRSASFVCALSLVSFTKKEQYTFIGKCDGEIIFQERGENGFGYDPIFFVKELNKTFAELSLQEKQQVSHRSIAFNKLIKHVSSI